MKTRKNLKQSLIFFLKEAENYFPYDYPYLEINRFESIALLALSSVFVKIEEQDFTAEKINYIFEKISNWCAWTNMNSFPLELQDENLEKLFSKIGNALLESYIKCLTKNYDIETLDSVLDEIAKDNYTQFIDSFLSKGIITKQQAFLAKNHAANVYSKNNINKNKDINKDFSLLITYTTIFLIILSVLIYSLTDSSFLETIAYTVTFVILTYCIYMLIFKWKINKEIDEYCNLKSSEYSNGNASSFDKRNSKHKTTTVINTANDAKSPTNNYIGQSIIEIYIGKNIEPYAEGYFDGHLPVLIARLRNKLIKDINFSLPPVAMIPSHLQGDNEFVIKFRKQEVARGKIDFSATNKYEYPLEFISEQLENSIKKYANKL